MKPPAAARKRMIPMIDTASPSIAFILARSRPADKQADAPGTRYS